MLIFIELNKINYSKMTIAKHINRMNQALQQILSNHETLIGICTYLVRINLILNF